MADHRIAGALSDTDLVRAWDTMAAGGNMKPNRYTMQILHNWLLNESGRLKKRGKDLYCPGVWVGKYDDTGEAVALFMYRDDDIQQFDTMCIFGWAAASGIADLKLKPCDVSDNHIKGRHYINWTQYLARVFGMNMGMPLYNFLNCFRWRPKDSTFDGAIARLRYAIDNPELIGDNGWVLDLISGKIELPYDILENELYEIDDEL